MFSQLNVSVILFLILNEKGLKVSFPFIAEKYMFLIQNRKFPSKDRIFA